MSVIERMDKLLMDIEDAGYTPVRFVLSRASHRAFMTEIANGPRQDLGTQEVEIEGQLMFRRTYREVPIKVVSGGEDIVFVEWERS